MADVTFRDFAMAMMQGQTETARGVLVTLLELAPERATAATAHFGAQLADPAFLQKAMGLRTAVTTGTDEEIGTILEDCFGLTGEDRAAAVIATRKRYPAP